MQQSNAFNQLRIIHIAVLISMVMFNVVAALVMTLQGGIALVDESFQRTLQVVCIGLSALFIILGFKVFKKKIFAARNSLEPGEKRIEMYRSACIGWWAMIEGPGIVAAVGFILSGNYAFFALAIVHLLILLAFAPRKANIILFLNLSSEEVGRLEGTGNKK
ncbi:MAG TPA: hypothetical protein VF008_15925 [Niastella sp.]